MLDMPPKTDSGPPFLELPRSSVGVQGCQNRMGPSEGLRFVSSSLLQRVTSKHEYQSKNIQGLYNSDSPRLPLQDRFQAKKDAKGHLIH